MDIKKLYVNGQKRQILLFMIGKVSNQSRKESRFKSICFTINSSIICFFVLGLLNCICQPQLLPVTMIYDVYNISILSVWFSYQQELNSLMFLLIFFKRELSHWMHLYGFPPVCFLRCIVCYPYLLLLKWLYNKIQMNQTICTLRWRLRR